MALLYESGRAPAQPLHLKFDPLPGNFLGVQTLKGNRKDGVPRLVVLNICGSVAKWTNAADCKSAGLCLRRFESSPAHRFDFGLGILESEVEDLEPHILTPKSALHVRE